MFCWDEQSQTFPFRIKKIKPRYKTIRIEMYEEGAPCRQNKTSSLLSPGFCIHYLSTNPKRNLKGHNLKIFIGRSIMNRRNDSEKFRALDNVDEWNQLQRHLSPHNSTIHIQNVEILKGEDGGGGGGGRGAAVSFQLPDIIFFNLKNYFTKI